MGKRTTWCVVGSLLIAVGVVASSDAECTNPTKCQHSGALSRTPRQSPTDEDLLCYGQKYPDLAAACERQYGRLKSILSQERCINWLRWHWRHYGSKEGRIGTCSLGTEEISGDGRFKQRSDHQEVISQHSGALLIPPRQSLNEKDFLIATYKSGISRIGWVPVPKHAIDIAHSYQSMEQVCGWLSSSIMTPQATTVKEVIIVYIVEPDVRDSAEAQENVAFFAKYGLELEQTKTPLAVLLPWIAHRAARPLVRACKLRIECHVHGYSSRLEIGLSALQRLLTTAAISPFENLVLLTSRVLGPLVPSWLPVQSWSEALSRTLTLDGANAWLATTQLELSSDFPSVNLSDAVVVMRSPLVSQLLLRGLHLLEQHALRMALEAGKGVRCLDPTFWDVDLLRMYQNRRLYSLTPQSESSSPLSLVFTRPSYNPVALHQYKTWMNAAPAHWFDQRLRNQQRNRRAKLLVVYAYFEAGDEQRRNLLHFLDHALDAPADFMVVVNGNATVQFPTHDRLRIIYQPNSCYDFGAWGLALREAASRGMRYSFFIVLNSSVRGPFLPILARATPGWYWTDAWLSMLGNGVRLVGLAVNCPDGVGRKAIHLMSMAMAFDSVALKMAQEQGIFDCAPSYHDAILLESNLSSMLLNAGHNIASMQWSYAGVDWRERMASLATAPLEPNVDRFPQCPGIALDIFYRRGWYFGMTAHPHEFLFYKTNRHVVPEEGLDRLASSTSFRQPVTTVSSMAASEGRTRLHIVLASHTWKADGAPRYLFNMGQVFAAQGHTITAISWQNGSLHDEYRQIGAHTVLIQDASLRMTLASLIRHLGYSSIAQGCQRIDLILCNTALFASVVASNTALSVNRPRLGWILHEMEIVPEITHANGFWYGQHVYPHLEPKSLPRVLAGADAVIFVSEVQRSLWSEHDFGNFHTIPGMADLRWTPGTISRERIGVPHSAFVMSMVGTVCRRKQQLWGIKALKSLLAAGADAYLLIIGIGNEDTQYSSRVQQAASALGSRVVLMPFNAHVHDILELVDLHLSASMLEAYPLNTIEAMAMGKPVIATAAGGTEEQYDPGDWMLVREVYNASTFVRTVEHAWREHLAGRLQSLGKLKQNKVVIRSSTQRFQRHTTQFLQRLLVPREPEVCFVIRTFSRQLTGPFNLSLTLSSLQNQEYTNWEAIIVQTDPRPMVGVHQLLAQVADSRFRFVRPRQLPKTTVGGYEVTDGAIEKCSSSAKWLIVTNGDNIYEPGFLSRVMAPKHAQADVVAFDFYSRSAHVLDGFMSGTGCSRFFWHPHAACKPNLLRLWHTDLGSNVLNLRRWRCEGRRFDTVDGGPSQEQDGLIAMSLVYWGWHVSHERADPLHGCLYHHSPNIVGCVRYGGEHALWDNTLGKERCLLNSSVEPVTLPAHHVSFPPVGTEEYNDRCLDGLVKDKAAA